MRSLPLPGLSRPPAAARLGRVLKMLRRWLRRRAERRQLVALSDGMLRDIGLTRAVVEEEYRRPIWEEIDYEALEAERHRRPASRYG